MGLDLSIRQQQDIKQNENGQQTWQVVEIATLRNAYEFLEQLNIQNCSTQNYEGSEIIDIIENLSDLVEKEYLSSELYDLIDKNETYEIHAWW